MLPIKHSTIFKSRWWALVWAAGIIWSAVSFVGSQSGGEDAAAGDNDAAAAAVTKVLG